MKKRQELRVRLQMKLRNLERQSSTPPMSRDTEADFPLSRLDSDLEQALITEMEMP